VRGRWSGGQRRIDAPLRKNVLKSGERMVQVAADGKAALSIFTPVAIYDTASLMEVKLISGRTHQVRVHAAHSGHPIAGDGKYGDEAFNRLMAELGLKRLFLHARSLRFTLPGEVTIAVEAPLEPVLEQVLGRLQRQ
jgi:23S rRNA pseudouridine955/2504/2580 synthase